MYALWIDFLKLLSENKVRKSYLKQEIVRFRT